MFNLNTILFALWCMGCVSKRINMNTYVKLPRDKGTIKYGDILISSMTHDVIVMYHVERRVPIVKVINEDIIFDLDEFISAWGYRIEIKKNVNDYVC